MVTTETTPQTVVPLTQEKKLAALLDATGVMFTPGSAMDIEGYVRIGYANNPDVLKLGLSKVSEFLREVH